MYFIAVADCQATFSQYLNVFCWLFRALILLEGILTVWAQEFTMKVKPRQSSWNKTSLQGKHTSPAHLRNWGRMTPQFLIGIHLRGNNTFCRFKHAKKWNVHLHLRWWVVSQRRSTRKKFEKWSKTNNSRLKVWLAYFSLRVISFSFYFCI